MTNFKKLLGQSDLVIQFDPRKDLGVWDVGPPFLATFKKRKVATAHVLNNGDIGLNDCEAFLEIIGLEQSVSGQFPLHWADTPYDALSSSMQPVTINPLREHRLDVAFTEENSIEGCSIASSQALTTGVKRDQFFLPPGNHQVRITVVSRSGERVRRNFIITSPIEWQKLNVRSEMENRVRVSQGLFDRWHSLNMTGPVKIAVLGLVGTIGAAVITGIFLLISTIIGHYFLKTEPQGKVAMSAVANTGSVQQQSAETIINNPSTFILPKSSIADDEDFERKLASGLYSYFVSVKDKLDKRQDVDTGRIKVYLASNRFFPLDIHVQIGNLLTSIENSNYEAGADQAKDVINKIATRYGIKLSETQLGNGLATSADRAMVPAIVENHEVISYNQQGGITAHTVTLQKPPRDFKEQEKQQLLTWLFPFKHRSVKISFSSPDREAFNYAKQIKDFLIENGWTVKGPNPAMFFSKEPRMGVNVKTGGEGDIEINVYPQG